MVHTGFLRETLINVFVFGGSFSRFHLIGADGEALPGEGIYTFPMDDTAWPVVTFTAMIKADSIPDTMTFRLQGQFGTVFEVKLAK